MSRHGSSYARGPMRAAGTTLGLIAMAAAMAGCSRAGGAPAASTPISSPTVAVSPTPSPVAWDGVVERTLARLADLSGRASTTHMWTRGEETFSETGSLEFDGDTEIERYSRADNDRTTEYISIGEDEWKRVDGGPWIPSDGTDDTPLADKLASIERLEVEREVAGDDGPLWLLGLPSGAELDSRIWRLVDEDHGLERADLELLVTADGTPVQLTLVRTWIESGDDGPISVKATGTLRFDEVGSHITAKPPEDAWVRARSPRGYSLALPAEVALASSGGGDIFTGGTIPELRISVADAADGQTVEAFAEDVIARYASAGEVHLVTQVRTIGGREAFLLVFGPAEPTADTEFTLVVAMVCDDRDVEASMPTTEPRGMSDIELLATIMGTFALTP